MVLMPFDVFTSFFFKKLRAQEEVKDPQAVLLFTESHNTVILIDVNYS